MLKDVSQVQPYEISEQIDVRKTLIKECVGQLYPKILGSEIKQLEQQKQQLLLEKLCRSQLRP